MAAGPGDSAATGYTCAQSDARAFVLRGEPVLVFCPRAFNTVPYKTITQAINAPTFKKPGAFLEEFDAWGGTMSHEWGHLVLGSV